MLRYLELRLWLEVVEVLPLGDVGGGAVAAVAESYAAGSLSALCLCDVVILEILRHVADLGAPYETRGRIQNQAENEMYDKFGGFVVRVRRQRNDAGR